MYDNENNPHPWACQLYINCIHMYCSEFAIFIKKHACNQAVNKLLKTATSLLVHRPVTLQGVRSKSHKIGR